MSQIGAEPIPPDWVDVASQHDRISAALNNLHVVGNPSARLLIKLFPVILGIGFLALYGLPQSSPWKGWVYLNASTAFLYLVFVFFFFTRLFDKVLAVFKTLWDRGVLFSSSGAPLTAEDYSRFLSEFNGNLNGRWGWYFAFAFTLVLSVTAHNPVPLTSLSDLFQGIPLSLGGLCILAIMTLRLLLMGIMLWRLIVIGYMVSRIPHRFKLSVQPAHPDLGGGLNPLGDLCLSMVWVLLPAAIYYAGWIVLISSPGLIKDDVVGYNDLYAANMTTYGWYSAVAIIVLTSLIAFFAPIYGIHREMLRQRLHYQQRLDKLTRQLDSVSRGLLDSDRVNGSTDTQTQLATLKELRDVYQTSNYFPVWPFNRNTLMKLTVSQVVPLLSLTGIGKPILDIVGNLLGQLSAK